MSPTTKITPAQTAGQKPSGCLPGAAILALLLLILMVAAALSLYMKPTNVLKYGLVTALNETETRLAREKTLSPEQYQELRVYVTAAQSFIANQKLDRPNLMRASLVIKAFRQALRDNVIDRDELAAIRAAVWRANIPLPVKPRNAPPKR
ncbi:MAG: hypothetical protein AB1439_02215 [candidate division FCPU426 bacterium]